MFRLMDSLASPEKVQKASNHVWRKVASRAAGESCYGASGASGLFPWAASCYLQERSVVPSREIDLAVERKARFENDPMKHTYRENDDEQE